MATGMSGRRYLGTLLAVTLVALGLAVAPAASAEPDPSPPPAPAAELDAPVGPVFSLADMGTVSPLSFYGDQGTAELTFPVPRGLTAVALNATVELPVNVSAGTLTVMQQDRTIARVALPTTDQAPIAIPLAGAAVVDNAVTVTLRTYLVPVAGYCLDPTNPLRLIKGAVAFSGVEAAPTVVAEFLPPILRRLIVAIPAKPSAAESDAAVRLAAAVTARYGQQPTAVSIVPLGPGLPPAGPFERQILIQGGSDPGLSLQPVPAALPNLRISGPDNELTNQSRLLASDTSRLALSSKAVVGPIKSSPQLAGDVTTLSALGQPVVSAVALAPQVALGVDQTRIGRPVRDVRVHLIGSYTPLPTSVSGRLVAIVGGETIDSWQVDATGLIDRWISVPDRLLQRYTTLGISLNLAGNTGRCGEFQPLTLTIDGDSVVQSKPAVPPVPPGLQSLPQALMPRTVIGIAPESFDDTVRAAAIAVAMQRLSALPIDTAVTSVDDALKSRGPAIVIDSGGWNHPEVRLPVNADGGRLTLDATAPQDQSAVTLTLDPQLRYGTLQAFHDGARSLLVATSNGAPGQLDALLRWMSADPRRWSALAGSAVIAAPGQEPVVVGAIGGDAPVPTAEAGDRPAIWVAGVVVLAAALGTVLIALRSRRRSG